MAETDHAVVNLVDAGVPADQGLSSLGLLMQLAGHVLGACAVFMFSLLLISEGSRGTPTLWLFVIFATGCMRSMFQLAAGKQLLYGEAGVAGNRLGGVRRYVRFALVQSVFAIVILRFPLHATGIVAVAFGLGAAVWPITLAVVLRLPRFARFDADLPTTEDKGFEGASILMAMFGLTAATATGIVLWVMFQLPGNQLQHGTNVLMLLAIAMLFARAVMHAHAGISGLRTTSLDHAVEHANRYANFGVITAFCAGGALLLFAMAGGMPFIGLAVVCGACWLLLAWPMIVRRFFADRQFADLLAGGAAPLHRRAPDAGLTWLGWFLFAAAAWNASFLLPNFMLSAHDRSAMMILAFGGTFGLHSLWWSVGLVVLQGWAGFELVRMSPQSKTIATVYGVIAAVLTLYLDWPVLDALRSWADDGMHVWSSPETIISFGPVAIALIMPIATIVLVQRKIAPTALARFREKAPDA